MNNQRLDRVFSALADSTRRGMLAQLADDGESNVRSLAIRYDISQPAISKHLRVLENAGLIRRTRRGRENIVTVNPLPIEEAANWIGIHAKFWHMHFDAVEDYLVANNKKLPKEDS